MNNKDQLKKAVEEGDIQFINNFANYLRFKCGMNYQEQADLFQRWCGVDSREFEILMQQCDELETHDAEKTKPKDYYKGDE